MYHTVSNDDEIILRYEDVNGTIYWVPLDPSNRHYQQYLAWVEEGNVAEEWNPDIIDGEV